MGMSEGGGGTRRMGPDTSGSMASARTLPSDARIDTVASADTVLAVPPAEPSEPSHRGDLLGGRYKVLGELGRGAEGVVYRARDLKADAIVALKLLQQDEGLRRAAPALPARAPDGAQGDAPERRAHPRSRGAARALRADDGAHRRRDARPAPRARQARPRRARPPRRRPRPRARRRPRGRGHAPRPQAGERHPASARRARGRDGLRRVARPPRAGAGRRRRAHLLDARSGADGAHAGGHHRRARRTTWRPSSSRDAPTSDRAADVYAYGMLLYEAATGQPLHEAETLGELRRLRLASPAPRLRDAAARPAEGPVRRGRPRAPARRTRALRRRRRAAGGHRAARGAGRTCAARSGVARGGRGAGPRARRRERSSCGARPPLRRRPSRRPRRALEAPRTPPLALHLANLHRITFGEACEEFPGFTPDGRSIVYDGTVGRDSFAYLLDVGPGATPRALTHVRGWDIAPAYRRGGDRIAFLRLEGERVGAYVAPLDGHEPPRMVVRGSVRPSWTRDGKAIWAGTGSPLAAYDVETGAVVRTMRDAPAVRTAMTVELADGSVLAALLHQTSDASVGGLAFFAPQEPMRWLLQGPLEEVLAVTADQRHAVALAADADGRGALDVPLDGSPVTSLASTGVDARQGLALSPDGTRVVWSACKEAPQIVGADRSGRGLRVLEGRPAGPSSRGVRAGHVGPRRRVGSRAASPSRGSCRWRATRRRARSRSATLSPRGDRRLERRRALRRVGPSARAARRLAARAIRGSRR